MVYDIPEHMQYKLNAEEQLTNITMKDGKVMIGGGTVEATEAMMNFVNQFYAGNQTELFNVQSAASASLQKHQQFLRDNGI